MQIQIPPGRYISDGSPYKKRKICGEWNENRLRTVNCGSHEREKRWGGVRMGCSVSCVGFNLTSVAQPEGRKMLGDIWRPMAREVLWWAQTYWVCRYHISCHMDITSCHTKNVCVCVCVCVSMCVQNNTRSWDCVLVGTTSTISGLDYIKHPS